MPCLYAGTKMLGVTCYFGRQSEAKEMREALHYKEGAYMAMHMKLMDVLDSASFEKMYRDREMLFVDTE